MLSDLVLLKCVKLLYYTDGTTAILLEDMYLTSFTDVSENLPKWRVLPCVPYVVLSIVHVRRFKRGDFLCDSPCIHTS